MMPDRVDLDYLRGKIAEYRRHAQALATTRGSERLLEIARQYETRLHELEARQPSSSRRAGR
jgi:N-methylhydantoinase A/oxoprolinase/acetone carboxylase beta subunit